MRVSRPVGRTGKERRSWAAHTHIRANSRGVSRDTRCVCPRPFRNNSTSRIVTPSLIVSRHPSCTRDSIHARFEDPARGDPRQTKPINHSPRRYSKVCLEKSGPPRARAARPVPSALSFRRQRGWILPDLRSCPAEFFFLRSTVLRRLCSLVAKLSAIGV